jgi:hypothetical protein
MGSGVNRYESTHSVLKRDMSIVSFSEIRDACRLVAERASFVHIRQDALQAYAEGLSLGDVITPIYDTDHHFLGEPAETATYILTLDAINFGSGYFPHLQKRSGMSGYFTVASSLKDYFTQRGVISANALTQLTPAACAAIFGQDLKHPLRAELMGLFAEALQALGAYLLKHFEGNFEALVIAAERSAARLVTLLSAMPFFQDVAEYQGLSVPLYKRAQITASDLSLAFGGEGLGTFEDLDELTIFADNLVPHVLHVDGLLDYDPALAERIDAGELILAGSAAEIELRAVALHTVEQLVTLLRKDGHQITAQQFDVFLWNRGQAQRYRKTPRHRTRTVFY